MVQRFHVLHAQRGVGTEPEPVRMYGMAPYKDRSGLKQSGQVQKIFFGLEERVVEHSKFLVRHT